MKKIIHTYCLSLILTTFLSGQELNGIGIYFGMVISNHTHYNPTRPQDGRTRWIPVGTYNFGAFKEHNLYKKLSLRHSLGYLQSGYIEEYQFSLGGITLDPSLQFNTFYNLSYEALLVYRPTNKKRFNFSPILGIEDNLLIGKNVGSETLTASLTYPVNQFEGNWALFRINGKIGFNLDIRNRISLDFLFTRSLSPVLRTETLVVRDRIWSTRIVIIIL